MTNRLQKFQVLEGGSAGSANHPLKVLLRPNLVLVWDRDRVLGSATVTPADDRELVHDG